jgi:hypothetical protein
VVEFEQSLKRYPPISPGKSDPYRRRGSKRETEVSRQ